MNIVTYKLYRELSFHMRTIIYYGQRFAVTINYSLEEVSWVRIMMYP